jgi:hypothetical protein
VYGDEFPMSRSGPITLGRFLKFLKFGEYHFEGHLDVED